MRDTRAHGRNMRRCRLHPTTCMEVKRLSDRVACLLEALSFFSLSPSLSDEIGNGAVIEVFKDDEMRLRHARNRDRPLSERAR